MGDMDGMFMSIGAVFGPENKSFEEVRVDDYLKAYIATGRPPQHPPQEPTNEDQRKAMGLPPSFKPLHFKLDSDGVPVIVKPPVTDSNGLPVAQEFQARVFDRDTTLQSICCMQEYKNFSHEELRYYAYIKGNTYPPTPVKMDPFTIPSSTNKITPVKPNLLRAAPTLLNVEDGSDMQALSCKPEYSSHSLEEHRIAYMLHGRQLTSAEIIAIANPSILPKPSAQASTPSSTSALTISTLPSNVPPPVFAIVKPSTPKFTFGLR